MPNILITNVCNLKCSYCFAAEKLSKDHMSLENVEYVIKFLKDSGWNLFRMIGGEPTLHPQFLEIMDMVLDAGMDIDLLSNALWSDEIMDRLLATNKVDYLLNIDKPSNYTQTQWERIHNNVSKLDKNRITLSFNIFEVVPKYAYLLDIIDKHKIKKVRLSFGLPVLDSNNKHLAMDDYPKAARNVKQIVELCNILGAGVRMDNAFPLCAFSYEDMGELVLDKVIDLERNASCRPTLDIGPDLSVWYCFCLSGFCNVNLKDYNNVKEIQGWYDMVIERYKNEVFPMEMCYECGYRELWGCQGGCLTFSLRTDHPSAT